MAEPQEAVATPPETPVDPYDLGDTSAPPIVYESKDATPPVEAPVTAAATEESAPERQRNADGTFAKQVQEHPNYLVQAATDFGFDADEIANTPTADLSRQCWRLQLAREAARKEAADFRSLNQDRQPAPAAPKPAEPDDEAITNELEKEGIDPRITGILRRLAQENKSLKSLRGQVGSISQRELDRETVARNEVFDDTFEALGPAYEKIFGKGDGDKMPVGDKRLVRRVSVLKQAGLLGGDAKVMNKRQMAQAIKEATELLYGDTVAPAEPAKPAVRDPYAETPAPAKNGKASPRITEKDWNEAGVGKPTHRDTEELPLGEERAIKNLKKKLGDDAQQVDDAAILDGFQN